MGRRPGPDEKKAALIVHVLMKHLDGVWLRQLARETGLAPSTVVAYLDTTLKPLVEESSIGETKPLLRVVKLKPIVADRFVAGEPIGRTLRMILLYKRIGSTRT
jgi:hypothetical protein